MKKFIEELSNDVPVPLRLMESLTKIDIENEKNLYYSEWSTKNNSNSACLSPSKPISKCYIVKNMKDDL